jgi:hypothetical protein
MYIAGLILITVLKEIDLQIQETPSKRASQSFLQDSAQEFLLLFIHISVAPVSSATKASLMRSNVLISNSLPLLSVISLQSLHNGF